MTQQKVFLFLSLTFLIALTGCSDKKKNPSDQNTEKSSLVLAVGVEPEEGFDPITGWGQYGAPLIQSTLLTYDKDFNLQKDLAKDYKLDEERLVWTVKIKEDVKFSDGKALTAEDVVFTFEKAKGSASLVDLTNLKEIEKLDDYTIQFTLDKPNSTFTNQLTNIGIVPKHAYSDSYKDNPIGSGPYKMVQWNKGQQVILESNPEYYGKKSIFKKLTLLFLSEDAAFAAARAGQVDVVYVPSTYADRSVNGMELKVVKSVDNRGIIMPFVPDEGKRNDGKPIGNNVTADIAIRKALNYAVDREELAKGVVNGYGTPAYTAVDHLPWWNPETAFEDGNMEKATEILENAGWKLNEKGIREKDGLKAEFTLYYPSGDQVRQSLSLAFAEMVKPLGIEVKARGENWNKLTSELLNANPVLFGYGTHDPMVLYNLFNSKNRGDGFNNSNYYYNEKVDQYLDAALHAKSQEEANEYWKKAQWDGETGTSVKGDAAWVWLVNLDHLYFIREGLEIGDQKLQPHAHGWSIMDFVYNWHWKE